MTEEEGEGQKRNKWKKQKEWKAEEERGGAQKVTHTLATEFLVGG